MMSSALKLLFLHMLCFHHAVVVVAKLRTDDKTQQKSILALSPALDVAIADISVKYNNVQGYNVHGCLDLDKDTKSKYSVQVQYEIRNSGDAGFIAPSQFVNYAACGTPAILNFLSLTIEGGRSSSDNPYPTIELSTFATCVVDDGNTADAAACVSTGPTTNFAVKPSQSYGISQGGSYGVSKTVRAKFPITPDQFNALKNSAPASLTFTLSVNKAISPNGAAGVVAAVDGSKLGEVTWQVTGQGTSVQLFIRPPSAAPTTAPTAALTTTPTTAPTSAPATVPSTAPTAAPTTAPITVPSTAPTTAPTALPLTAPTTAPTTVPSTAPTTAPTALPSAIPTIARTTEPSASPIICDNIIEPDWGEGRISNNRYNMDPTLGRVCLTTNVQSIGDDAFRNDGATSISSIYIPSSVKTIREAAFWRTKLTSVIFAGDIESIGNYAFFELNLYIQTPPISLAFPGAVGTIGTHAFFNSRVASVSFGGTVGSIGFQAFYENPIQTVIFPAGLSYLGEYAFHYNALTSVTFLGAVATIENNVFSYNPGLLTVYHPRSWAIPTGKFNTGGPAVTFVATD